MPLVASNGGREVWAACPGSATGSIICLWRPGRQRGAAGGDQPLVVREADARRRSTPRARAPNERDVHRDPSRRARAAELPRTSLRSATTNGTRGFATVAVGRHDRLPGALAGSNESPAAPSFDTAHACTHRRRHVSTPIWMRPGSQGAKDSPMLPQEVPSPIWTPSSSRKSCSQVWRRCRKRREWRLRLVGRPGRATAATQACDSARRCSMRNRASARPSSRPHGFCGISPDLCIDT